MQHWQAKSWSPAPRSPTEPLAGSPAWAHTAQRPAATECWLEAIFIYQQDTFSQCLVGSEKLCVNAMDCVWDWVCMHQRTYKKKHCLPLKSRTVSKIYYSVFLILYL